jgi:Lactate dehydrogenase and related dehydrogenases
MYESFGEVSLLNNIEQMESSTADLKDVEIVVVRLGIYWSAALLQQLPRLRCIVTPTTGLTHIDMAAYEAKHISILSLKK